MLRHRNTASTTKEQPPTDPASSSSSVSSPNGGGPRVVFAPEEIRRGASSSSAGEDLSVVVPPSFLPLLSSDISATGVDEIPTDCQSIGSCSNTSYTASKSKWSGRYTPPPVISQGLILTIGFVCFVLAYLWPPLILLLAYVASKIVPYSFRINDSASLRRQLFNEFASDEDHPDNFKQIPSNIRLEESYWINDRGMALSTLLMQPRNPSQQQPIKAIVCLCHGYSDNLSYSKKIEYQRLVHAGIAVIGIEYEGHGRSDGPLCLIENWDRMIDDVSRYFDETVHKRFSTTIPVFLMGESMGGAVAYSVYNRNPDLYRGVVFVCPMCKISDDMLPPQWVIDILSWLVGPTGSPSSWLGLLPIAPSKNDLFETAHHVPHKAEQIYRCPTSYCRNPRLVTARELLQATSHISASLKDFDAPFLILHGREDRITDPQLSLSLYRESKSTDKSIRLYDGMWHAITCSEPDENIDRVFHDCVEWILKRSNHKL